MITDPVFYAAAIPAILLVGLSKGGFGSIGILAIPIMTMVISPVQAAAIMLPILIAMDMIGLISYRGIYHRPSLTLLLPAAILGIGTGWAMAQFFTDDLIRLVIGVIAFAFAIDYWRRPAATRKIAREPNPAKGVVCGAISGFTSFLAHAGGPPYQMYMLPLRMEPRLFAGTAVIFFTTVNMLKVIPYLALGQFSTTNLATSAILLPLAPLATLAGVKIVRHIPKDPFYTVTYVFVFLASLKLLWDGIGGLLTG